LRAGSARDGCPQAADRHEPERHEYFQLLHGTVSSLVVQRIFGILLLILNNGQIVTGTWIDRFNAVAFTLLISLVMHRFGIVATTMLLFADNVVSGRAADYRLDRVVVDATILAAVMSVGLVSFAYCAARAGEPLFGKVLAE
jgi:hypothetical protein